MKQLQNNKQAPGQKNHLGGYSAILCPPLPPISPVALVPDPGVVRGPRPEVRLAVVVDLRGEAEEAAVGAGVGRVGAAGQAVLLLGTLQHVHGPVLQVGGLLHHLGVQDQVWGRWRGEEGRGGAALVGSCCNTKSQS